MTLLSDIHSNILTATTEPSLLARFREMLRSSERVDIAVGYLFLSGFTEVIDEFERLDAVRVLVGRTDRPTLEALATGLQQAEALHAQVHLDGLVKKSERKAVSEEAADTIAEGVARLGQNDRAERGIRRLRDLVASGRLQVKTYPRGMLHAKAYLCWYANHAEKGAAIVGSSNFTLSGFSGNTELNVRVTGDAEMAALGVWFQNLWADAIDVTDDVLVRLDRSWPLAQTTPYHVYLKTLYELYNAELGLPAVEPQKRGAPQLANFQLDAVRRGLAMVERHGGCFIGDVVGLGKTYIGAEVVRQLQLSEPAGRHPLIVCPAGLMPMWEMVSERFGLGAQVVSMSNIAPAPGAQFDEESGEYIDAEWSGGGIELEAAYPTRGVVLVDEAHNFRNASTRRYRALYDYLWSGDRKVVLLSATPQNLGPTDIYHQLRLFLDDLDHGLNIEPLHLKEYFSAIQHWYAYEVELENWKLEYGRWQIDSQRKGAKRVPPPEAPQQPSDPYATIDQVLNPVFVRRRRKDIRELYGEHVEVAGLPVLFPEPVLDNLDYRLDKVYERAFQFTELQARLALHKGARYLAIQYLRPEARHKEEYRDLLRARNRVAILMRHLLVKRLESSVAAFRSTLEVLMRSNRHFREALGQGFVPVGQTATNILSGRSFDPEELLERLYREERKRTAAGAAREKMVHPVADFDVERWTADLDADYTLLHTLQECLDRIRPEDDDKLQRLKTFLAQHGVAGEKILLFSEAAATIDYLYDQLNPGGVDPTIAKVTGSNRDSIQELVKRFAPRANLGPKERIPGPEIRILLATDVVSEGQNLQDCNRVVNYDLHWNPVRLIQRFGRVDRIGTTHNRIYLHNTWPDTAVDAELSLTERLTNRIQAFHDFIGLDARLLSDTERLNPAAMYRIYAEQRLPEEEETALDDVSAFQRGVSLLQQIQENDPETWKLLTSLPDGIRSAITVPEPDVESSLLRFIEDSFAGPLQLTLMGEMQLPLGAMPAGSPPAAPLDAPRAGESVVLLKQADVPLVYAVGSDLKPRRITPTQLVRAVECEATTPAKALPAETNKRVMAAFEQACYDAATRLGSAKRPTSNTRLRRYVSKHLRALRDEHQRDEEELSRISVLQQIFLDHLPVRVIEELDEVRRLGLTGPSLVRRLEALRVRHRLNPPDEDGHEPGMEAGVMRIICSEGLV